MVGISDRPRNLSGQYDGAALQDAHKSKERTYQELLRSRQCRLVVLALETGGRLEPGSNNFPPPPCPDKSQSSSQHPPQSCPSFPPVTLVSHPHACGPACIRGQSPGLMPAPALLMGTPPSASFCQKRPFPPRLPAVSQPAP